MPYEGDMHKMGAGTPEGTTEAGGLQHSCGLTGPPAQRIGRGQSWTGPLPTPPRVQEAAPAPEAPTLLGQMSSLGTKCVDAFRHPG